MAESPVEAELPSGPLGDLVGALRELHRDAGRLSLRKMSQLIREHANLPDTVSHDTISAMLRGERAPQWRKLSCLVTVLVAASVRRPDLDATLEQFHKLWIKTGPSTDSVPHRGEQPGPEHGGTLAKLVQAYTLRTGLPVALPPITETTGPVWAVAFSPDGRLLASTEDTVRLWEARTGKLFRSLPGHTEIVWGVAFSPDGRQLATASHDKTVRLWDLTETEPTAEVVNHQNIVWGVAFSPDGRLFATACADGNARLWHRESGASRILTGHTGAVYRVAFSPDGRLLATASKDRTVRLWDVANCVPVGEPLEGHTGRVNEAVFSPDGLLLATASADQTATLWDVAKRQPLRSLDGHAGVVEGVAFSLDGEKLATTSHDGTVRLWDMKTRRPLGGPLHGGRAAIFRAAFSPDGHLLAAASRDAAIKLWAFR